MTSFMSWIHQPAIKELMYQKTNKIRPISEPEFNEFIHKISNNEILSNEDTSINHEMKFETILKDECNKEFEIAVDPTASVRETFVKGIW